MAAQALHWSHLLEIWEERMMKPLGYISKKKAKQNMEENGGRRRTTRDERTAKTATKAGVILV